MAILYVVVSLLTWVALSGDARSQDDLRSKKQVFCYEADLTDHMSFAVRTLEALVRVRELEPAERQCSPEVTIAEAEGRITKELFLSRAEIPAMPEASSVDENTGACAFAHPAGPKGNMFVLISGDADVGDVLGCTLPAYTTALRFFHHRSR